jgi:DNA processing protein
VTADREEALSTRRYLHGQPARRRAVCIWLGTLASWRGGLVKRLVAEFGSVGRVLDRQPAELAAAVSKPGIARRGAKSGSAPSQSPVEGDPQREAAERSQEEARFAAALVQDPVTCAQAQERGPGTAVIAWCDPLYPPALRQLADAPLCLFVRAACPEADLARRLESVCRASAVAVVGTRAPSPYGQEMAAVLGRDLTTQGILVVSGLAMGIDAAAQASALRAAGRGAMVATVGVLGCGADLVYPRTNRGLYADVAARGLLLSEFAWGVPARAWRFPARNRVMAALCRGVVVVEGAARSGARLTADYALDLGREVLAVPGEAGRRLTETPHQLLRYGAPICESALDVVHAIATVRLPDAAELAGDLDPQVIAALLQEGSDCGRQAGVLQALERGAMTADQVARTCGLRIHEAGALLSELEVDGLVALHDGGVYRLRRV